MEARIKTELAKIIGLPLESTGRVCNLQWFSFGRKRIVFDSKGKEHQSAEYALHVECAWRITLSARCSSRFTGLLCATGGLERGRRGFENWRLFQPWSGKKHFVHSGRR